jgi:hypothetical protein
MENENEGERQDLSADTKCSLTSQGQARSEPQLAPHLRLVPQTLMGSMAFALKCFSPPVSNSVS